MIHITIEKSTCEHGATVFTAHPAEICIGAMDANGVDRLHVDMPADWADCVVRVTFRSKDRPPVCYVLDADGNADITNAITGGGCGRLVVDAEKANYAAYSTDVSWVTYGHSKSGSAVTLTAAKTEYERMVELVQSIRNDVSSGALDGYTPVRGTDYWTAADIAAIQAYVDKQVPTDAVAANTAARHTHANAAVLDGITADRVAQWTSPTPAYVQTEAEAVAQRVTDVQTGRTLTIGCLSDIHYPYGADSADATRHAAQGFGRIRETVRLNLCAMLGDVISGASGDTKTISDPHFRTVNRMLSEAFGREKQLRTAGNHDCLPYNAAGSYTPDELFARIGAFSDTERDTGNRNGGYGFIDFDDLKFRVIGLNTCDIDGIALKTAADDFSACRIGAPQLAWLIGTALNFSDKTDVSDWSVVLLGHHPLDWTPATYTDANEKTWAMSVAPALAVLDAYVQGSSGSASVDGTAIRYDFSSGSRAKIVCQLHGHTHNYVTGTMGTSGIWRLACPNVLPGRENEYTNKTGMAEETTYGKTAGTKDDTSFCIFTIDPVSETIYAHHYGAGYDRTLSYHRDSYTNILTSAINSDGTPFNGGAGWIADYRINSSGNQVSASGCCCTGFMPVENGDVIRLKNVQMESNSSTCIVAYDASFGYLTSGNVAQCACASNLVWGDDGYLQQFTMDKANVAYIRLSTAVTGGIGDESVVTKNETIA